MGRTTTYFRAGSRTVLHKEWCFFCLLCEDGENRQTLAAVRPTGHLRCAYEVAASRASQPYTHCAILLCAAPCRGPTLSCVLVTDDPDPESIVNILVSKCRASNLRQCTVLQCSAFHPLANSQCYHSNIFHRRFSAAESTAHKKAAKPAKMGTLVCITPNKIYPHGDWDA